MPWDKKANAIKISRAQPMLSDVLLCWHNFLFNLCIFFAGFPPWMLLTSSLPCSFNALGLSVVEGNICTVVNVPSTFNDIICCCQNAA